MCAGALLGNAAPPVISVSGFRWDRLLKPDQARLPFFAEVAQTQAQGALTGSLAEVQSPQASSEEVLKQV